MKRRNRYIKRQRHTIRRLLLSNSSLLNIIEAITYVYGIHLCDDTEKIIENVADMTYRETLNLRATRDNDRDTMISRDTQTEVEGDYMSRCSSPCLDSDQQYLNASWYSTDRSLEYGDHSTEFAATLSPPPSVILENDVTKPICYNSRTRPRDRSRSQSDLMCVKIPEEITEEHEVEPAQSVPSPQSLSPPTSSNTTKPTCKRTYSMGSISNPVRIFKDNFKSSSKKDSSSPKKDYSSSEKLEKVQENGFTNSSESEKNTENSPRKYRGKAPQRDNSFIQSMKSFLRPRDVKKKNRLRARSESLPLGLSVPFHEETTQIKRKSDSFTLYVDS